MIVDLRRCPLCRGTGHLELGQRDLDLFHAGMIEGISRAAALADEAGKYSGDWSPTTPSQLSEVVAEVTRKTAATTAGSIAKAIRYLAERLSTTYPPRTTP